MKTSQIDHPVYTLDNRLLLAADTRLTPDVLDAMIETNKDTPYQAHPFLEFGNVFQDLLQFLKMPPYYFIFDEPAKRTAIGIMEGICFIPPVLESLNYFKKSDFYTYRHFLIVFALATIMSNDLLENSRDRIIGATAGHMHDFGKICVPLQILKKTHPLTRTERGILEHHTLAGFALLSYFLKDSKSFAARVAKEHHERRDGSGYPLGISLKDRMVEIISVCDVYDALLSSRPYRITPYDNRTALEEITEMAHRGQLSWELVQTLVSYNRKGKPHFEEIRVSTVKRGIPPVDNLYGITVDEGPPTNNEGQDD